MIILDCGVADVLGRMFRGCIGEDGVVTFR